MIHFFQFLYLLKSTFPRGTPFSRKLVFVTWPAIHFQASCIYVCAVFGGTGDFLDAGFCRWLGFTLMKVRAVTW